MTDIVDRLKTALADRYRIERELGSGGMATVYLAEDLKHRRQVAVKVLRPELAAVLGAHRFLNEINVTAQLQHPHILPLFDSGEADGLLYYVMPYVEGVSLEERLRREKQLSIEESLRITGAVASALSHAHRHGVLHRDIKPGNILLHEGDATVADFGIAVAVRAAAGDRLTETGLSLGTPQYMSPEQATGDRELDARSDVYSLGAVLYEMLAGDPPHTGPTVQAVISKVVTEHPRPVGELRDTVPVHIETALDKALAKLPADRFTTAEEFAVALERSGAEVVSAGRRTVVAGTAWAERAVRLGSLALTWAVLATAVAVWAMLRPPPAGPVTRWSVKLMKGQSPSRRTGHGLRTRQRARESPGSSSAIWTTSPHVRSRARRAPAARSSLPTESGSASSRPTDSSACQSPVGRRSRSARFRPSRPAPPGYPTTRFTSSA
jgi:serine/threonine-protein kinase